MKWFNVHWRDLSPIRMVPFDEYLYVYNIRITLKCMCLCVFGCVWYRRKRILYILAFGHQIASKNSLNLFFFYQIFHLLRNSNSDWFIDVFGRRHKKKTQTAKAFRLDGFSFDGNLRNHTNEHKKSHHRQMRGGVRGRGRTRETEKERDWA